MSTRSQVEFYEEEPKEESLFTAKIYVHCDGYPEGALPKIQAAYDLATTNYRNSSGFAYRIKDLYASDIAAFYILANKKGAGDVEIDNMQHGDIDYLYKVWAEEGVPYVVVLSPNHVVFKGTLESAMNLEWE